MNGQQGRINPGLAILLALVALAFLLLNTRGCMYVPGTHFFENNWFGHGFFGPWRFLTVSGLLQLVLAVWVGVDAQKRGSNGYLWGLLVFVTSIVGLVVYLLWLSGTMEKISEGVHRSQAPPAAAEEVVVDAVVLACPACGGDVEENFKVCPACGKSLRCPGCDKTVREGWTVCPWCATGLGGHPPVPTG